MEWSKWFHGITHLESDNGREFGTVEVFSWDFAEAVIYSWDSHKHYGFKTFRGSGAADEAKKYVESVLFPRA